MYTNDWIMRQIEIMSAVLANLLFSRKPESEELSAFRDAFANGEMLAVRLSGLLAEGRVNEAENILFEALDESPGPEYLKVALDFYGALTALSDGELEARGFSRDEIYEGLSEIQSIFLPGMPAGQ